MLKQKQESTIGRPKSRWAVVFSGFLPAIFPILISAQEDAPEKIEPVKLDQITSNFEAWQDDQGFAWQVTRQGALQSGQIPYFQGVLSLFAGGSPFIPAKGVRYDGGAASDAGAELSLSGKIGETAVERNIWFDAVRGGVRVIDTFENTGSRKSNLRVDLKSGYQSPWQDLHGTEGRILGPKPGDGMSSRDFGVLVKFSQAEGRHDTLFVTSAEEGEVRPMISFASNLRELTFSYDLEIGPGKSAALMHWVVQRNLRTPADAQSALRPFYQRRRLVNPGVKADLIPLVRNFDPQSFPEEGVVPFDLDALVALNRLTESLGLHRRGEDILWITSENQLSGQVNGGASLEVETEFGTRKVGIGKVAAIQGGGGIGRTPRVFLRDGRVLVGEVKAEKLTMKIAEGWDVEELRPDEISLLLLRLGNDDGRPPEGTILFVETRTGNVVAVSPGASDSDEPLSILSPWGEDQVSLKELRHLRYANGDAPKFRMLRSDGTRLTVLLNAGTVGLKLVSGGENLALPTASVAGAWMPGESFGAETDLDDDWFDFEDTGLPESEIPGTVCLLLGNNLLKGDLKMEALNLVSGSTVTPLNAADIAGVRRSPDSDNEVSPEFEIRLRGGEVLTGHLRERILIIQSLNREWRVPVQHFVAYQADKPE